MTKTRGDNSVRRKMLEDLARSGLGQAHTKKLGLKPLTARQTYELVEKNLISYLIPYFDLEGHQVSFFRVRFLEERLGFKKKPLRYTQPRSTLPKFYLPPFVNWKNLAADPTADLYLTEGEKKAAKATLEGFPTIGLGGVWSWRSTKHKLEYLDDFALFTWLGRKVWLVFDSDLHVKPDVQAALNALARTLLALGAKPGVVYLPGEPGCEKLDDFLVARGAEAFTALPSDDYEESKALWQMNEEYAVIRKPPTIMDMKSHELAKAHQFTGVLASHRKHTIVVDGKLKQVKTAQTWLEWPHRREYLSLTYAPGEDVVTSDGSYNIWRPSPIEPRTPKKNELNDYFRLRDWLFGNELDSVEWFERWCAYPLQHPGTKLYTAVMIQSPVHGIGKSLLGILIGKLYGPNFLNIEANQLKQPFNQWALNRQFILGDEITGTDRRADADQLKNLITREQIEINTKGIPQYYVPDCINYFLTSNHPDALYLEPSDRRFFIVSCNRPKLDDDIYSRLDTFHRSPEKLGALLGYFMSIDTADFNPRSEALRTPSKDLMTSTSMTAVEAWAQQLLSDPDSVLVLDGKPVPGDLFTSSDLLSFYDSDAKREKAISLGRALSKLSFHQLHLTNKGLRLYVVRNHKRWVDVKTGAKLATENEIFRAYTQHRGRSSLQLVKSEKY